MVATVAAGGIAVIGLRVALGERYDAGDFVGMAVFLGVLTILTATPIVLMLRAQRRGRQRRLAEAGPGAVFASVASEYRVESADRPKRWRWIAHLSSGVLTVATAGVSYTHLRPGQRFDETRLSWSQIEALECERENVARAFVRVRTTTRQVHTWRVAGAHDLETALRTLQVDDAPAQRSIDDMSP
jgi:hypothetical protein